MSCLSIQRFNIMSTATLPQVVRSLSADSNYYMEEQQPKSKSPKLQKQLKIKGLPIRCQFIKRQLKLR